MLTSLFRDAKKSTKFNFLFFEIVDIYCEMKLKTRLHLNMKNILVLHEKMCLFANLTLVCHRRRRLFSLRNLTECHTSVRRCCYITLAPACLLRQACTTLDSPSYPEKKPHFKQAKNKKKGYRDFWEREERKITVHFVCLNCVHNNINNNRTKQQHKKGGIYIGMREFNNLC